VGSIYAEKFLVAARTAQRELSLRLLSKDQALRNRTVEIVNRTAKIAEEAVQERRKTLREIAKVERMIDRKQAQTARTLHRLVEGPAKL
jgi:hypothetical protein